MFSAPPLKKRPNIPLDDDSTHSKRPRLETKSSKENMYLQTANKNLENSLAILNKFFNKQQLYLVHESNVKDTSVIWKDATNYLSLLAEAAASQSAIPIDNLPDFPQIGIDDD